MPDVLEALDALEEASRLAEQAVLLYTDVDNLKNVDRGEAIEIFDSIKGTRDRLKVMADQVTKTLSKKTSRGDVIPAARSGQAYEKKIGQNKKTWQHSKLKAVAAEKLIAKHTDEDGVLGPISQIIIEAWSLVSMSGWKKTTCEPLGINVDQYCEVTDGNVTFAPVSVDPEEKKEEDDGDFI